MWAFLAVVILGILCGFLAFPKKQKIVTVQISYNEPRTFFSYGTRSGKPIFSQLHFDNVDVAVSYKNGKLHIIGRNLICLYVKHQVLHVTRHKPSDFDSGDYNRYWVLETEKMVDIVTAKGNGSCTFENTDGILTGAKAYVRGKSQHFKFYNVPVTDRESISCHSLAMRLDDYDY